MTKCLKEQQVIYWDIWNNNKHSAFKSFSLFGCGYMAKNMNIFPL